MRIGTMNNESNLQQDCYLSAGNFRTDCKHGCQKKGGTGCY